MNWVKTIEPNKPVIICKHVLANPQLLTCVYHAGDGTISMVCDNEHDMENGLDLTWIHSSHLLEMFPQLASLGKVPLGSMGYYFKDYGQWRVDEML